MGIKASPLYGVVPLSAYVPGAVGRALLARGRMGYYPLDIDAESAARLNSAFGVPDGLDGKAVLDAMVAGSMFGWHVPAANP